MSLDKHVQPSAILFYFVHTHTHTHTQIYNGVPRPIAGVQYAVALQIEDAIAVENTTIHVAICVALSLPFHLALPLSLQVVFSWSLRLAFPIPVAWPHQ